MSGAQTDGPAIAVARGPDERQLREAAALHCRLLPGSAIARFGQGFARSFYRYANRSPAESVFAAIDSGAIIAAALVSYRPHDLQSRMLIHTSLFAAMATHPIAAAQIMRERLFVRTEGDIDPTLPEVIAIFTEAGRQGQGIGARLLRAVEAELSTRGLRQYCVRTEDAPDNRAIAFYDKQGFSVVGRTRTPQGGFRVMVRRIDGGMERANPARKG